MLVLYIVRLLLRGELWRRNKSDRKGCLIVLFLVFAHLRTVQLVLHLPARSKIPFDALFGEYLVPYVSHFEASFGDRV